MISPRERAQGTAARRFFVARLVGKPARSGREEREGMIESRRNAKARPSASRGFKRAQPGNTLNHAAR